MSLRKICRKTAVALICLTLGLLCAVPLGAVSTDGDSFPVLDFETAYEFSLTENTVFAGTDSTLTFAEGVYTVSASGSGSETVSLSIISSAGFDASVLAKEQATLHIAVTIKDLNGFLDSSGNFRGGTVMLTLPGIEYKWSLDGINVVQGENRFHLNIRTAEKIYPEDSSSENGDGIVAYTDEEEEEIVSDTSYTLEISLKKLPSVANASFSVGSAAIEIIKLPSADEEEQEAPLEEDHGTLIVIAMFIGVVLVAAICISVTVVTAKEEEKKRRRRRKKRAVAKESERSRENEL